MNRKNFEEKICAEFDELGTSNKLTYREIDEFHKIQTILTGNEHKFNHITVSKPNKLIFNFKTITDFILLFDHSTTGAEIKNSTYFTVYNHIIEFYNKNKICIGVYPIELLHKIKIL